MLDKPAVFLRRARQEAGNINKRHDRNFKRVAVAHKARGFARGIRVQHARQHHRLVGDDAHCAPFDATETGNDVAGVFRGKLVEVALIDHLPDQLLHVIGLVGVIGDQRIEAEIAAERIILARPFRHAFLIVRRQEVDEAADLQEGLDIIVEGAVSDRGLRGVDRRAAEFLMRDDLVRHGLHHVGAGDIHVRGVTHHEDEVRHRWRIDVAAGARPHDDRDLRNDAGSRHVALEDIGIAREARHTFLNAGAAAVVEADDRRAHPERHFLNLADLLGMGFGERAAENREILREDEDLAPVDRAPAGDDTVAGDLLGLVHPEIDAAMLHEHVEFLEAAVVQQQFKAFARGQLALGVLRLDPLVAAALAGLFAADVQLIEDIAHRVFSLRPFFSRLIYGGHAPAKHRENGRSFAIRLSTILPFGHSARVTSM